MEADNNAPEIVFPDGFLGRWEEEATCKGYLQDVLVKCADGSRFKLYFVDPIRLGQELDEDVKSGRPFFGEPNLIVLPNVTTEAVREAVHRLYLEGYFDRSSPEKRGSRVARVTEFDYAGAP